MALSAVQAPGFQRGAGVRTSQQRIEWVKVTVAAADTTAANVVYTMNEIKSCAGIIGSGPIEATINNNNRTVTFAPAATAVRGGTYFIGLVEG